MGFTAPINPVARSYARQRAMQALYQWQLTRQDLQTIETQFMHHQEMDRVDVAYFTRLLHDIPQQISELDALYTPSLDRPVAQLDPVERAILWIGSYELTRDEVPWRVAIDESVGLAKKFGAEQSYKYINSILDGVAKQVRKSA